MTDGKRNWRRRRKNLSYVLFGYTFDEQLSKKWKRGKPFDVCAAALALPVCCCCFAAAIFPHNTVVDPLDFPCASSSSSFASVGTRMNRFRSAVLRLFLFCCLITTMNMCMVYVRHGMAFAFFLFPSPFRYFLVSMTLFSTNRNPILQRTCALRTKSSLTFRMSMHEQTHTDTRTQPNWGKLIFTTLVNHSEPNVPFVHSTARSPLTHTQTQCVSLPDCCCENNYVKH